MGWSGRAPAPPAISWPGASRQGARHVPDTERCNGWYRYRQELFHIVSHDERGAIVLRQKWSRGQVEARFANMPPCLVGMEACVGAHHLSRKLNSLGTQCPADYSEVRSSLFQRAEE